MIGKAHPFLITLPPIVLLWWNLLRRRELLKISAALLGTGVSASLSRAVLAGADVVSGAASANFAEAERLAVELLCDMIIPTTDTPGALQAGVPDFIALIVFDWYTESEREAFFTGLQALDAHCLTGEQVAFHQASESTRGAALREQEQVGGGFKSPPNLFGGFWDGPELPFFKRIKELVVLGYYTSEVGATQELIYMPIPGEFKGDVDFAEVGRQWTY